MKNLRLAPALALFLGLASVQLIACETEAGSCERVVEACHPKDTGSGKPHDCHEAAEAAGVTDAECAKTEDECLEACK
ncbi:MAG: hypothetical protein U0414_12860 [Polyangiaceae bacterium]